MVVVEVVEVVWGWERVGTDVGIGDVRDGGGWQGWEGMERKRWRGRKSRR